MCSSVSEPECSMSNTSSRSSASNHDNRQVFASFPCQTKLWTTQHLELCGIYPDFSFLPDPAEFLRDELKCILGLLKYSNFVELKKTDHFIKEITPCLKTLFHAFEVIDMEYFNDLNITDIEKLKDSLHNWGYTCTNDKKLSLEALEFCRGAEVHGQGFAEQLEYMISFKNCEHHLLQGMFQQLLFQFLKIFNLKAYAHPNIKENSTTFRGKTLCSSADLLITDYKNLYTQQLIAVVKVDKDYGDCSSQSGARLDHHVSPDIMSQHCGDLLCHLPLSAFRERGILGLIVQATKVCFTSLVPEEDYTKYMNGETNDKKGARLRISEQYNILSVAGREALTDAFTEMLSLQRITKSRGSFLVPEIYSQ